jgi:uncharacterized membrane protein
LPLLLGLVFFAASLTPSLIPRPWFVQGALAGIGYVIGQLVRQPVGFVPYCLHSVPTLWCAMEKQPR